MKIHNSCVTMEEYVDTQSENLETYKKIASSEQTYLCHMLFLVYYQRENLDPQS